MTHKELENRRLDLVDKEDQLQHDMIVAIKKLVGNKPGCFVTHISYGYGDDKVYGIEVFGPDHDEYSPDEENVFLLMDCAGRPVNEILEAANLFTLSRLLGAIEHEKYRTCDTKERAMTLEPWLDVQRRNIKAASCTWGRDN